MAEYEDDLLIEERQINIDGLYCDGIAWIKENMTDAKKYCVLAEEIGHHNTSVGDILNLNDIDNVKQEFKARKWAYEKILPIELILGTLQSGIYTIWDMAEYLDVDENFLKDALEHYGLL